MPVAVYNNKKGRDAEVLRRFKEPAWNYQVIRFLDRDGRDLIPRRDKVWTLGGVAGRMCLALEAASRKVPGYLLGIWQSCDNPDLREVSFGMHCFWTGEMKLGGLDGVVRTEAGFYERMEVTRVWYDSSRLALADLARKASEFKCAAAVFAPREDQKKELAGMKDLKLRIGGFEEGKYKAAPASDQKKQIEKSAFLELGLSPFQLAKVNAFARTEPKRAMDFLSPSQKAELERIKAAAGKAGGDGRKGE